MYDKIHDNFWPEVERSLQQTIGIFMFLNSNETYFSFLYRGKIKIKRYHYPLNPFLFVEHLNL